MDTRDSYENLHKARKALLALAAGAHGEHTVDPKWVVATALQGLGVGTPIATPAFIRGEQSS